MTQVLGYTVSVYELNDEAVEFMEWFKASNYVDDFSVEITKENDTDVVEVVQYNPFLSADALQEIYLTETGKNMGAHVCKDCEAKQLTN